MATKLSVAALELDTYVVQASFHDEDGDPVVPKTIKWTLTDQARAVVNSREEEPFTPVASVVDILLTGDDLALTGYSGVWRKILVEATYDSDLGVNLSSKQEGWFRIEHLDAVPH